MNHGWRGSLEDCHRRRSDDVEDVGPTGEVVVAERCCLTEEEPTLKSRHAPPALSECDQRLGSPEKKYGRVGGQLVPRGGNFRGPGIGKAGSTQGRWREVSVQPTRR